MYKLIILINNKIILNELKIKIFEYGSIKYIALWIDKTFYRYG